MLVARPCVRARQGACGVGVYPKLARAALHIGVASAAREATVVPLAGQEVLAQALHGTLTFQQILLG